jgi:hypothetical protein
MTIFDYFEAFFSKFQKMVLFWLSMSVCRPKNGVGIKNMFPNPSFSKRVKKGIKGTLY